MAALDPSEKDANSPIFCNYKAMCQKGISQPFTKLVYAL